MLKMLVLTVKVLRAPETRAMVLTATSVLLQPVLRPDYPTMTREQ